MPQVVSYQNVAPLGNANNIDGYDMDTVGALLNTIKAGLENDQTEDTATLVNVVANQTAIAGEKKFTGHLRSTKTPLQISDNDDVINLNFFNYKIQDSVKYYGNWSSSTNYEYNAMTWYSGHVYICKVANTNVVPDSDTTKWKQLTDVRKSYVDDGDTVLQNNINLKAPIDNPTFTGTVNGITKSMVGLGNVNNTSDANKPISTDTQAALDLKAPLLNPTFTGTVNGITKSMVGLGNVDNTADTLKPVSVATQNALNLKADLAGPTFTGTVSGITKSMVGLGNVDNTSDADKPVSTAQQSALDLKANLASPTFTGTVSGITKSMVGLANVDNTSDVNKPVSTAQQAALDLKCDLSSNYDKYYSDWSDTTTYNVNSIVSYGNNTYVSLVASNLNFVPTNALKWREIAATQAAVDLKANIASPTFTGTVSGITKSMVGLGNCDNTSDANKPVSTAQQSALDLKANLASPTFTGTVSGITKSMVGLANVDNTSDTNKPVSTAQQTALDLKANLADPTFTGTVSGITKSMVGLANVDNTSDANKPVSTAQQSALDLKANLAGPTFTGTVSGITKSMVGLANVDNTSDTNKPVSTAQQAALDLKCDLSSNYDKYYSDWSDTTTYNVNSIVSYGNNTYVSLVGSNLNFIPSSYPLKWREIAATQAAVDLKANIASPTFTGTVSGITKSMVGLANVDNTSDANKPVSTAQQSALDLKANLAGPTFTGTVSGITKSMVGLANVDNTTDANKPVSTAQQTALDLKANLADPTFTGKKTQEVERLI